MPGYLDERSEIRLHADRPIRTVDEDKLGFQAYADAFSLVINDPQTATPLVVAISGPWGSGKTSLSNLIETRLSFDKYWVRGGWADPPITCRFNAWMHADADHLGAALAASVARTVAPERAWWWRICNPLPQAMISPERVWWRRVIHGCLVAVAAVVALVGVLALVPELRAAQGPVGAMFGRTPTFTVWWAAVPVLVALAVRVFRMTDSFGQFVDEPKSAAARGAIAQVQRQIGRIIRQAQGRTLSGRRRRRVVIFIDDLERCPGNKALDVCEVASQLLALPDVVTVIVGDLDMIAVAAEERYPARGDAEVPAGAVGELYLEKLIQLQFTLPPLSEADVAAVLAMRSGS
jgi:hypothetical protein